MTEQQATTATERVQGYVDVYMARMSYPNSSYDGHIHAFGLGDSEVKLTVQDLEMLLKLSKLTDSAIRAAEKRGMQEMRSLIVSEYESTGNAEEIVSRIEGGDL